MAERRLKPGWRVLGALALLLLVWFGAPRVLRRLEFFRVRRIEVQGLRNLTADQVVAGLKVPPRISVFDDLRGVERRARALPGIAEASVGARWPGTLRVTIHESEPVALFPRGNGLRLLDVAGRVLPFDPTVGAPDLPLARDADSLVTGLLARVRDVSPELFARVSAGWRVRDDVVLQVDKQRYWFRPDAPAEAIRAVMAVSQDLTRKGKAFAELDGRFDGMVVVRWRAA